jgi:hypothetical protein
MRRGINFSWRKAPEADAVYVPLRAELTGEVEG